MENHKQSGPKSGHGRLQEVVVYWRFQLEGFDWENFWMGGGYTWNFDCNVLEQNWNFPTVPTQISRSHSSDSPPPYPSHFNVFHEP